MVKLKDNSIITLHPGYEKNFNINKQVNNINLNDIKNNKFNSKYNFFTLEELIFLLKKYNVYLILDIKDTNNYYYIIDNIYRLCDGYSIERLIPQVFCHNSLNYVTKKFSKCIINW